MKNNTLTRLLLSFAALFLLAVPAFAQGGQSIVTQTTLASAVNGPAGYSGTTSITSTTVCLASVTGIQAPQTPGSPASVIYVGREAMGVWAVNATSGCLSVSRGYLGTQASPHPSGDAVLVEPAYNVSNGGNPVPAGFFQQDAPAGGACSPGLVTSSPWVNVLTGAQWLCSTITNTWVPGFQNPMTTITDAPTTAVASATTILPTGPLFHLTGTTSVTTITDPVGCDATAVGGCQFTVICDAICTWASSGNISAAAGTMVANTSVTFIWDAKNSKWVPSTTT